jgi:hypothetical protein
MDIIEPPGHPPYENNVIGIYLWYRDPSVSKLLCLCELIPSVTEIIGSSSSSADTTADLFWIKPSTEPMM